VVADYGNDTKASGDGYVQHNEIHKHAYHAFISLKYGFLGRGHRIRIPNCVLDRIRDLWPNSMEDGEYMGFMEK
jgi:hypothetical protein